MEAEALLPHEEVVTERLEKLQEYLLSVKPYIILPSVLICHTTKMIIDGHHRFYALLNLGFKTVPVTLVDYSSDRIVPDLEGKVNKRTLVQAALNRKMLPPKTSFHHVVDDQEKCQPIILLSPLFKLDLGV